ncbi:MAG: hypothetical protein ACRBF0_25455 [Calditrichia bacterium]
MPLRYSQSALICVLLAITVLLGGCGEKSSPDVSENLQFDVNPELLAAAYSDATHGISIHPPAHWEKASAPLFEAFKDRLAQQMISDSLYRLSPVQLFGSFEDGRILIVSEIESATSVSSLTEFAKSYRADLNNKFPGVSIRETNFAINGIPVFQYLLMLDKMVAFKLVLESPGGKHLQLDYSISRQNYEGLLKSIEASIGSLRAL